MLKHWSFLVLVICIAVGIVRSQTKPPEIPCKKVGGFCAEKCSKLREDAISGITTPDIDDNATGCVAPKAKCCKPKPAIDCVTAGGTCRGKCDAINDNEILAVKAGIDKTTGCDKPMLKNCCVKKEGKYCRIENGGKCRESCLENEANQSENNGPSVAKVVDCPYDKQKKVQLACCRNKDDVCAYYGGKCQKGGGCESSLMCPAGYGKWSTLLTYPESSTIINFVVHKMDQEPKI